MEGKLVKFITDLVIEERLIPEGMEVMEYFHQWGSSLEPDSELGFVTTTYVPIIDIHQRNLNSEGNPVIDSTYIAYTNEVCELLQMPFNLISDELGLERSSNRDLRVSERALKGTVTDLERELEQIKSYGLWDRIKFLITGKLTPSK